MKTITFYFDPISPYAYLAFERLPLALEGVSYAVQYRPVFFAGLLKHYGQLGPAEIAAKRTWTYRQVLWQARSLEIPFAMPAAHPFNPLGLLRLAVACGHEGACNRYVAEKVLRHVWLGAADAGCAQRLTDLTASLAPAREPTSDAVKTALAANTQMAIDNAVFGVPSMVVDGQTFWGLDALPMLSQFLRGDAWFDSPAWREAGALPVGVQRAVAAKNVPNTAS